MKQELPFAVALLATGCLLWFLQLRPTKPPANAIPQSQSQAISDSIAQLAGTRPDDKKKDQLSSNIAGQVTYLKDLEAESESQPGPITEPAKHADEGNRSGNASGWEDEATEDRFATIDNRLQAPAAFVHDHSDPDSVQLLASISQRLAGSQPFGSTLQLTGVMFGQSVSADGNYFQMGQGTSKSRLELRFGGGPDAPTVFQLCDGRFVYRLQTNRSNRAESKQTFEFVDLHRVRESAQEKVNQISPTGWMATGGISSLFQHLASAFNFGTIESIDESTIVLRGSWDQEALRRIVTNSNQKSLPGLSIRWDTVPSQVPHAVELVLQKHPSFLYYPIRVSFLKIVEGKHGLVQPMVRLTLSSPRPLGSVSNHFFVIDSAGLKPDDATDRYIARIQTFDNPSQTAENRSTLER